MSDALWVGGGVALLYFLIMIPVEYRYIASMQDWEAKAGSQSAAYERMPFEEEQLHYHMQGIWNLPSALVARGIHAARAGTRGKK